MWKRPRLALLRAPAFQHDHRFDAARVAQYVEEPPAVFRGFDVHADDARLRIGEIEFEQVARRHVGAVADGDEPGELEAAREIRAG